VNGIGVGQSGGSEVIDRQVQNSPLLAFLAARHGSKPWLLHKHQLTACLASEFRSAVEVELPGRSSVEHLNQNSPLLMAVQGGVQIDRRGEPRREKPA